MVGLAAGTLLEWEKTTRYTMGGAEGEVTTSVTVGEALRRAAGAAFVNDADSMGGDDSAKRLATGADATPAAAAAAAVVASNAAAASDFLGGPGRRGVELQPALALPPLPLGPPVPPPGVPPPWPRPQDTPPGMPPPGTCHHSG